MRSVKTNADIRTTSYDESEARPFGQTADQIRQDAAEERQRERNGFRRPQHSDRYWLLLFLGLEPSKFGEA